MSMSKTEGDSAELDFQHVASLSALEEAGRLHLKVQGRYVSLIRHRSKVYCIDSTCYHAGGPLGLGDIEELNGEACIVCPWHFYKVTLSKGGKLYQPLEMTPGGKMVPAKKWKEKESAQRTHKVKISEDKIYVQLSNTGKYDSDEYGKNVLCGEQCHSGKETKATARAGSDGKLSGGYGARNLPQRSGHVLSKSKFKFGKISSGPLFNRKRADESLDLKSKLPSSVDSRLAENKDNENKKTESKTDGVTWHNIKLSKLEKHGERGIHLTLPMDQLMESSRIKPEVALPEDAFKVYHVNLGISNREGEYVSRPFTFVNSTVENSCKGADAEFFIRTYENGTFTKHLDNSITSINVQDSLGVSTPDQFLKNMKWNELKVCVLFAGGSGITPMLQVIQNLLACPQSESKIYLFYSNKNVESSLALSLLNTLSKKNPNMLSITLIFSEECTNESKVTERLDDEFTSHFGKRITSSVVKDVVQEIDDLDNSVMIWSGPTGFNLAVKQISEELISFDINRTYGFEG